jgi:hypothetical protein
VRKEGKKMSENNEKQLPVQNETISEEKLDTAAGGAISIGGAIRGAKSGAYLGKAVSKGQSVATRATMVAKNALAGAKAGAKGWSIR